MRLAPIGFLLAVSIAGSVMAQDQFGTDAHPLVVKPISNPNNPFRVEPSTDWPLFFVALGIGLLQLVVFGVQSYLLWETVLSSNLPKIIIRRIVIETPDIDSRPVTQPFRKHDELHGRFTFINIGRRKATISQSNSMFFITDKPLPMKPPYDVDANNPSLDLTLKPGWSGSTPIIKPITIDDIPNDPYWKLYVMGWIDCVYKQPFLKSRSVSRVYFCRVWNSNRFRFIPLDNPDYESEEIV